MEQADFNSEHNCSSNTRNSSAAIDNERALIRLAQGGCQRSRNQLLLDNQRPIEQLVAKNCRFAQDFSDLEQEAILALMSSIDKYDLDHPAKVRLMTFARKQILGALASFVRSAAAIPLTLEDPSPIIDDRAEPLDSQVDQGRLRALLSPFIDTLDDRSRAIIRRRVMSDDPTRLRVLADDYQISCARVHAIERQALSRVEALIQSQAPELIPIYVHC